ncbi:MAG: ATP-dependent DNA ligase, partial [Actinobacteria bacterium]|nr:ATP-dependent DNA ligase [Actinomycetota bacterium]
RYAGQVGSGLNELLLRHLASTFGYLATDTGAFVERPPLALHYVRPEVVVEVQYSQVTTVGVLRQPSVKGIRDDVDPTAVGWTDELA